MTLPDGVYIGISTLGCVLSLKTTEPGGHTADPVYIEHNVIQTPCMKHTKTMVSYVHLM